MVLQRRDARVQVQQRFGFVVGVYFDILVLDLLFFEHEPDSLHEGAEPACVELQGVLGNMSPVNASVSLLFRVYLNLRNEK